MICPQCRAEYLEGFTMCSDCEVALVPRYETDSALDIPPAPAEPGDPSRDPFAHSGKETIAVFTRN